MNDEKIEQLLRELPTPELPPTWRTDILSKARYDAHASKSAQHSWPIVRLYLRDLCLRNPITAMAIVALWTLIFFFKVTTPVDPQEKELIAHFDPTRPVDFVSINDRLFLAQLELDQPECQPLRPMP